jgi:hypothetical protein
MGQDGRTGAKVNITWTNKGDSAASLTCLLNVTVMDSSGNEIAYGGAEAGSAEFQPAVW